MALLLAVGNVVFWRFDPRQPLWCRILKVVVTLASTAAVFRYLGTVGVIVWFAIVILPIVYIHGIWLARHGVNGWTAEPREKYYVLRGWPPPDARRHR
jgi:hypothetical protein